MHKTYFVTAAHFDISRHNNPLWSLEVPSILLLCCWKGPSGDIISMKHWSLCNNAKVGCVSKSSINRDVSSHCIVPAPLAPTSFGLWAAVPAFALHLRQSARRHDPFYRFSLLLTRQLWEQTIHVLPNYHFLEYLDADFLPCFSQCEKASLQLQNSTLSLDLDKSVQVWEAFKWCSV